MFFFRSALEVCHVGLFHELSDFAVTRDSYTMSGTWLDFQSQKKQSFQRKVLGRCLFFTFCEGKNRCCFVFAWRIGMSKFFRSQTESGGLLPEIRREPLRGRIYVFGRTLLQWLGDVFERGFVLGSKVFLPSGPPCLLIVSPIWPFCRYCTWVFLSSFQNQTKKCKKYMMLLMIEMRWYGHGSKKMPLKNHRWRSGLVFLTKPRVDWGTRYFWPSSPHLI